MATGKQYLIKFHETEAGIVFDSVVLRDFTYDATFTATRTSFIKNDIYGTDYDAFIVKISYIAADVPSYSISIDDMLAAAIAVVNASLPNEIPPAPAPPP